MAAKGHTMTRVSIKALDEAKEVVAANPQFSSVAHLLELKIHEEYLKTKRAEKAQK